jgi:transforming growth factor-beta-induced protein
MKKRFFQFLMLVTFTGVVLSSCKKDDDDDDNTPTQNIVEIAQGNPDFSILVQALTRSDLSTNYATVLSGDGPFTVFAPTNAAFQALLTELGAGSLADIPAATLEEVLKYHVVSGKVLAGSLTEGQVVTTLQGGTFTIGLSGGAKITDGQARVSNITTTDLEATNGVIHVVDKVILP